MRSLTFLLPFLLPFLQPFETNVPFVLRYMIDSDITGAGWLSLPGGSYSLRPSADKKTHCQLEIDISYKEIIARKCEGEWSKVAPLRILSFDIECQGRKGYFPEAEKDPVIQIANVVSVYGEKAPVVKNVFTLKVRGWLVSTRSAARPPFR